MAAYQGQSCNYGYGYRRGRSKVDWAGVCMGDAFKANRDYYVRLPAQRMFYEAARVVQEAAAVAAGGVVDHTFETQSKVQLSPFYTSYPSNLSAFAALGLTGFLEYSSRVSERTLPRIVQSRTASPGLLGARHVDPEILKRMVADVSGCVHERLLLAELARAERLASVEYYRLFLAAQQDLRFESVTAILRAMVLFGDLLPDWRNLELHDMTRALLRDLSDASAPFLARLPEAAGRNLLPLGMEWVTELCRALAPYLPRKREKKPDPVVDEMMQKLAAKQAQQDPQHRFGSPEEEEPPAIDRIPPLDEPRPPSLFEQGSLAESIKESLRQPSADGENPFNLDPSDQPNMDSAAEAALKEFAAAVDAAVGQTSKWEDMRSDLLEVKLRTSGFERGPIEGTATDGHTVDVRFGNHEASGELFDRPVELSGDQRAYDKLQKEAAPVTTALRRSLYPNVQQTPHVERFQACGSSFDPARLAVAEVSSTAFRRFRVHEQLDRRGQPVLLIACDGSGSLDHQQMRMTKLLACAWLNSTARSRIQVLAGLYHSGEVRSGQSGPLVQWMFHPRKTPVTSRTDAARSLVTLPDRGTGIQSDALSIAFMVDEARQVARGSSVYLILISDCAWNQCFPNSDNPRDEVAACLASLQDESGERLHTTLVAVGVDQETGFEEQLDKVITVAAADLADPASVAGQIGEYVATCMRERRSFNRRT